MITIYKKQASILTVTIVLTVVMFAGQITISSNNSAFAFIRFHGGEFHHGFHGGEFHHGFHGGEFHHGFHGGEFHHGFHRGEFHHGFHGGEFHQFFFHHPFNDEGGFEHPFFPNDDGEHSHVDQSISQSCIQPQSTSVLSSGANSPVVSSGNNVASCANVNLGGNAAAINQ